MALAQVDLHMSFPWAKNKRFHMACRNSKDMSGYVNGRHRTLAPSRIACS